MEPLATGYGLIEGPVWDAGQGLYYSDVTHGGVYRLSPSGEVSTVLPHRRSIGGMALHQAGGLVVGGRNIAFKSLDGARTVVLLDSDVTPDAVGFNDLTTDAAGRIYVGSLAFRVFAGDTPKPGHLHVIDLDGSVRTLADGVMLTNGLGFSPDGARLYHCDSHADIIRVYDVHYDGSVSPWRVFARVEGGTPDGRIGNSNAILPQYSWECIPRSRRHATRGSSPVAGGPALGSTRPVYSCWGRGAAAREAAATFTGCIKRV